jgi:hypothetical protein
MTSPSKQQGDDTKVDRCFASGALKTRLAMAWAKD